MIKQQKLSDDRQKRIVYFDYLRIFAIGAIVVLHMASQNWYVTDISSTEWNIFNIYDSLMRWGVPVFVMISGALFLKKEQPIQKLYKKNILKILIILVLWTLIYNLWQLIITDNNITMKTFLINVASEPYYLWFLYMLIGLYMVTPFLRRIVENEKTTKYFLALSFLFAFLVPELVGIIALKSEFMATLIENKLDMMRLFMVLGFTGYFVLGYYLNEHNIKRKTEWAIYILGLVGAIFTIISTLSLSNLKGEANAFFYNNMTINVAMMSAAVFIFFKKHAHSEPRTLRRKKVLQLLSRCSLGVYLTHILVLETMSSVFKLDSLSFSPIISIPILSLLVLSTSYIISIALYKIPFIGKWIV